MKTHIANLEGKLKATSQITPEEKANIENALAQAMVDKESAIKEKDVALFEKESVIRERDAALHEKESAVKERGVALYDKIVALEVNEITRSDLNKATGQITDLTMEKDRLSEKVSSLKNLIRGIESEKTENFGNRLILARLHTESFPDWEHIDWSTFKPPSKVQSLVPPYFLQPGKIKSLVKKYSSQEKKKNDQPTDQPTLNMHITIFLCN